MNALNTPAISVLALALVLRVGWAVLVPAVPISDGAAYDAFAQNIAAGHGYGWTEDRPSAYWAVGTSAIYAFFYFLFGHHYEPIVALNVVLSVAIVALSIILAKKWFGPNTAFAAGLLLALWPGQIQYVNLLASEIPFTFLVLSATAMWAAEKPNHWIKTLLTGVLIAAAAYVRPTALLFPVIFCGIDAIKTKSIGKPALSAAIMLGVVAVLIAPWSIRNSRVFDEFVLLSTNSGDTFWMGNNPQSDGGYMPLPEYTADMTETQREDHLREQAMEFIRENPLRFAQLTLKKLVMFHAWETTNVVWNALALEMRGLKTWNLPLRVFSNLYFRFAVLLAAAGVVLYAVRNKPASLVVLPPFVLWAYFAAVHALIHVQDRFHFPIVPFLAMFAGSTLVAGVSRIKRYIQSR